MVLYCFPEKNKKTYYVTFLPLNYTKIYKFFIHGNIPTGEIDKCFKYQSISISEGKGKVYTKKKTVFLKNRHQKRGFEISKKSVF